MTAEWKFMHVCLIINIHSYLVDYFDLIQVTLWTTF